jgi:formate C-acetyltransferase
LPDVRPCRFGDTSVDLRRNALQRRIRCGGLYFFRHYTWGLIWIKRELILLFLWHDPLFLFGFFRTVILKVNQGILTIRRIGMYEFRPVTKRIREMRQLVRDRICQHDSERARIVTEYCKENENLASILKRAYMLYEVCSKQTIRVEDFDLIVGNKGKYLFSVPSFPEWGTGNWLFPMIDGDVWTLDEKGFYKSPPGEVVPQIINREDYEIIVSYKDFWKGKTNGTIADASKPDELLELERLEASSYLPRFIGMVGLAAGHLIAGYEKIINTGYSAIRRQAQSWIDEHYGNKMGDDIPKDLFYRSAVIACDAGTLLCQRYAEACRDKAAQITDPERKSELMTMSEGLAWIAENPARTFWEACQATMIYQVLLHQSSVIPSPSFGRFDQYTWPFLKRDLAEGRINEEKAQEIVDAFFLKANCFYSPGRGDVVDVTGAGNTYQHTTVGGVHPETGEDATNPVTYMVLETVGRLQLHDPTISLRFNQHSPDKLWDCALATSKLVGGLPLYQNDEVIIPSLINELGFELRDARDYGLIGCQEIVGCGNDYPAPNGTYPPHAGVLWGTVFNMAINNGINPLNGEQASIQTGYLSDMKSIEEVRTAVEKMARHILKLYVTVQNYAEYFGQQTTTEAALSISIEGCMEKGKDCTHGGAKYNSYGGTATGLATLGDSLSTIKYMVFDKGYCTGKELLDAVLANWEGHETLRQQILSEVPHYGNNEPYADEELKWVVDLYYQICTECYSMRSQVYKAGLYGASDHVKQGHNTWATPDGRRYGEPIADAMSPAQSRDKNGPTAVFASTCCFDHHHFLDGIALNLRMHPSTLSREDGIAKLRDMTKTYFMNGGMEVQYNVVDTETLKKAQKTPEEYRDLVVRIAGYSAYFVELGKDLQNDIIARHENII